MKLSHNKSSITLNGIPVTAAIIFDSATGKLLSMGEQSAIEEELHHYHEPSVRLVIFDKVAAHNVEHYRALLQEIRDYPGYVGKWWRDVNNPVKPVK